jgi:hypothetical protein
MLQQIELTFAVIGVLAVLYGIFCLGRMSERRRRKPRQQRKPAAAPVPQFKTAGEAGLALAAEMNKRKPDPDRIDALVRAQNALRRAG